MKKFATATASLLAMFAIAACGNGDDGKAKAADSGVGTEKTASGSKAGSQMAVLDLDNKGTSEMYLGSLDAPVTLIEYASSTCPACATTHEMIFPELKEKYIDTGKVRFVFREFPTAPAKLAYITFAISRCNADENGPEGYFTFLDGYFRTQRQWVIADNPMQEIAKIAGEAGYSEDDIKACVNREEIIEAINANIQSGMKEYSVDATPTYILNGSEMERYASAEEFLAQIDEKLGIEPEDKADSDDAAQ